jgi:hypothetical protein
MGSMIMIYVFIVAVIVFIAALQSLLSNKKKKPRVLRPAYHERTSPILPTPLVVTMNEQPTFFTLRHALPDCFICPQVAFSALLQSKYQYTRNRFNKLRVDFVVLDKNFKVLAIIELDDSSHLLTTKKDQARDAMFIEAGYRVIRYLHTPSIEKVKNDFRDFLVVDSSEATAA